MYVENRDGLIDGVRARIGWVTFSKTGRAVYYKGCTLKSIGGRGLRGNFMDEETGEEFWVSGVKRSGTNTHPAEHTAVPVIDDDAKEEFRRLRGVGRRAG
jgi:hypothetical protein